jgi:hypothetical protein
MNKLLVVVALVLAPALARADAVPAPTVKLVSPGKGKAQQLRVTPAKGAKQTLVITTQQSKARGLKGKLGPAEWTPALRMTGEVEVKDVTADGDIHYAFSYTKIEALPDKRVKAELAKAYEAALAPLVGIKGSGITSNRGITKDVKFDVPADASDALKAALAMARGAATQLAQPLPDEAVGIGAKWQTTSTAVIGEITAVTNATYKLVALEGTQAKLEVTVSVKGTGSGAGNLTTEAKGGGATTIDLTSFIPTASAVDLRTETGLDMDGHRLLQIDTNKVTMVAK